MHNDTKQLGGVIRRAREFKELTQAEIAKEIGVSLRTITAIESGERNTSFVVVRRLIRALDIPAEIIFPSTKN